MKLFLASEAKHPESLKKFKKFVKRDLKGMKAVYIPTAANGKYYGSWKGGESVKIAQSLGMDLKIVQLEDSCYSDITAPLCEADIIWMAGGMSGYLLYWIKRTKLDKILPDILNNGTIYIGSSAGSLICAKTQNIAEWYIGEAEPGASLIPGLGLIDFEIYPHYEEKDYDEIKKRWEKGRLYLIKNGEAITVENNKINVLGKERIIDK